MRPFCSQDTGRRVRNRHTQAAGTCISAVSRFTGVAIVEYDEGGPMLTERTSLDTLHINDPGFEKPVDTED